MMWVLVAVALASIRDIMEGDSETRLPVVIGTWGFENAAQAAWDVIRDSTSPEAALDAVQVGCARCEVDQCDGTVGFGGSPDENGETRLDAMIMDGNTGNVGAVGSMGGIKSAASVARHVLDHTKHTLLVGDLATRFAVQMGFKEEPLETEGSIEKWKRWKTRDCQPNFWMNVTPDPTKTCGPYSSSSAKTFNWLSERSKFGTEGNHDTIAMVAVDKGGRIAAGTSTNGASFKIPGRVGDSPIPGSGAYADSDVGGAAATGDGDVMMRFLPSFLAVELMRSGASPSIAAKTSVERIIAKQPGFVGAVVAVNKEGKFGAACHGLGHFPFSVGTPVTGHVRVLRIDCINRKTVEWPSVSVNQLSHGWLTYLG